jgi:hypothetical protein
MSCDTQTFNLGVVGILLGKDRVQSTCIQCKADVSSSLNNKYIVMHEPVTQTKHYFWFNVAAAGTDPAVPNSTGHAVAISANATASAVASALNGVINPLSWVNSTVSGDHIEAEMVAFGYAYEARNALDNADSPDFTITVSTFGSTQEDLGSTNGDTSFTVEESNLEIKSPQTGDYILEEIRKGASVSASFELKNTAVASVRRALNFYGSTIVTDDVASETLSGYGSKNLFKSTSDVATQLIFRPLKFIEDANPSEDFTIHKCKLKLGEITFSAENELVLPIEAVGYLDTSKSSFVNMFSYGDAASVPNA